MCKVAGVEGVTNSEVDVRRDGKVKLAPMDVIRRDVRPLPLSH